MNEVTLTPLEARRQEVAQYQANIDMYKSIAAVLPSQYPDHLVQYKGTKEKHTVIAGIEDLDDVALLGDLWAYDEAQAFIRSETLEMRKAMSILAVLEQGK